MMTVDITPYRAFWLAHDRVEWTPDMRAIAERARAEAVRLAQLFAVEFGVQRVYLFGSLAWGPEFRPDSDIDLAVEGLPRGQLLNAVGALETASEYGVDLVLLEKTTAALRELILTSGTLLYDAHPSTDSGSSPA